MNVSEAALVQKPILVVDEDDGRRRAIAQALAGRGLRYLDVGDAFAGMAALGRADFGCVLGMEGRRTLSLRGLCQLARKRHPDIIIFVSPRPGSTEEGIRKVLELPFFLLEANASAERLVTDLVTRIQAIDEPTQVNGIAIPVARAPRVTDVDGVNEADLFGEGSIPVDGFDELNPFEMPSTADANAVFDSPPSTSPPMEIPLLGQQTALTTPSLPAPMTDPVTPMPALPRIPTPQGGTVLSIAPAPAQLVVDGHFEDLDGGAGAAFMMSLFAQELTGRLDVDDGDACGALFLYRGESVWAEDPQGDAGLYRKLVQKGLLKPDEAVAPVDEGGLLGSLMQAGQLTSPQMHDFMRDLVRERIIAIATQQEGSYHFTEDKSFLDTEPLFRVNSFGLVLDSRRRALPPPALMALQSEIEDRYPIPGPGIGAADEKLTPFLRGAKASVVFDGQRTVRDTLSSVGLDPFMGTLVVVTLRDARLVTLEEAPRQAGMDLAERAYTDELTLEISVDADGATEEEARAREDIYSLYMRLKPLSQPRQILGVGVDADDATIDAAYHSRLAELDPRRIPEGSAQQILGKRVEELQHKVTSAYQALKLQLASTTSNDNPF